MGKFFVIWNPDGRPPVYRHFTLDDAEREAQRLSRISPGKTFIILEALHAFRAEEIPVKKMALNDLDEIPF